MKVPELPLIDVFGRGGALKSSWYGDCLPSRDFPMLLDLYRHGRFDLDAFVSERIGLGAAINTGGVGRGMSVAVIGCGGVGAGAVAGSVLAGASRVIAVDIDDRKLEWARGLGATHTVNSKDADPVEQIQQLTDGFGADVVIDAVGRPETWKQAFYARDLAGTVVLVGVPTPEMRVPDIPLIDVFGRGGALKSSWYGDCLPSRDFPMLVDLYLQGRLDLDAFVSEEIALGDVEEAFDKMHRGDVLRSVVVLDGDGRPQ
jgi:S-(hydroxymethyl)mycothiol dehydrogenase